MSNREKVDVPNGRNVKRLILQRAEMSKDVQRVNFLLAQEFLSLIDNSDSK